VRELAREIAERPHAPRAARPRARAAARPTRRLLQRRAARARPRMRPASTSPDPRVPSPALPPSCRHRRPSGDATCVIAPLSTTTASSAARPRARRRRVALHRVLVASIRCAISPRAA
jgi:hypothetical protein